MHFESSPSGGRGEGKDVRNNLLPIWYAVTQVVVPQPSESHLWESLEMRSSNNKNVDSMVRYYETTRPYDLVEEKERFVAILNYWALQYLNECRYTLAFQLLKTVEQFLHKVPRSLELRKVTLCNLARYFKQRRKIKEAIQYFDQVLRMEAATNDYVEPGLHINYGVLLCFCNRYGDAVRNHFGKAISPLHIQYARKGTRESLAMLVVAYYNMWIARAALRMRGAADFLHRAAQLLRDAPKEIRPCALAKKVEDSLTALAPQQVGEQGGEPGPEAIVPRFREMTKEGKQRAKSPPYYLPPSTAPHSTVPRQTFRTKFVMFPDKLQKVHEGRSIVPTPTRRVATASSEDSPPNAPESPKALSLKTPLFSTRPTCRASNLKPGSPLFMMYMHGMPERPKLPEKKMVTEDVSTVPAEFQVQLDSQKVIKPITPALPRKIVQASRLSAIALLKKNTHAIAGNLKAQSSAIKIQSLFRGWSIRQTPKEELRKQAAARREMEEKAKGAVRNARRAMFQYGAVQKIESSYRRYLRRKSSRLGRVVGGSASEAENIEEEAT